MRLLLSLLVFFNFSFHGQPSADKKPLDGIWRPVSLEINGAPLPEGSFRDQRLTISDSSYIFVAESVDKGVVRYHGGKMDIYGRDGVNNGKHFMTIYKLEREKLTICYNLAGDKYPESFSTKGQPMYFMAVFEKVEK